MMEKDKLSEIILHGSITLCSHIRWKESVELEAAFPFIIRNGKSRVYKLHWL